MTDHRVDVVTVTRGRPDGLRRAMDSVAGQVGVSVRHIVVGDACPALADGRFRAELQRRFPAAVVHNEERPPEASGEYVFSRLARLRNLGVALGDNPYVGHLDDDNAYRSDHLARLAQCLEDDPDAGVAHSWRRLTTPDGREFVPRGIDPWQPDPDAARASYRDLAKIGVFTPGSPVVRDVFRHGDRLIARLDTNELLVRRTVHETIPFPTEYSAARRRLQWSEDFAFAVRLGREGIGVTCSERPTVDYTMGGLSNTTATEGTA
ncbi:glycosyltransferase family 2 protein [Salininema proteolyticum]|uniref:Glycosyltransferase family 2 protein n=1 Tax=Salininema proteolyticum TaxID=1607685 RepID=A0ABV8U291_9ACTN